jgi:acyl-CoA synthetase (NDP forming)
MQTTTHIGALLSPRSVAVIGAAPAGQGLRGRILETMLAHPYKGRIYPISRSHAEVQGLKAYASIAECPERVDCAVLIIPGKFVAEELARCGEAGVKAAIILSSGFAEESGETGRAMQAEIAAVARRYGMAVTGPNCEGHASTAENFCPTFSPTVAPGAGPLVPAGGGRGRVAVIAQSGGMGFAFYDRGRPKEMAFDYVVTTGNEACLETFEIVEHLIDAGKTDAFCLLIEDIKSPATFKRAAEKALRAGIPLIVNKIGKTDAGARAAASHTAALAGSYASFQALSQRYGLIEGTHTEEMVDIAQGFLAWKGRMPAGRRIGICTGSGGGGGWMADACMGAGLEVPTLDAATRARIDPLLPPYGTSQNPVDGTAQAIRQLGYAGMASHVASSPVIDAVVCVMSARSAHTLEQEVDKLAELKAASTKPIMMWSYTLPAQRSVEIVTGAGFPFFTNMQSCVSTLRHMADWSAHRERFLKTPVVHTASANAQEQASSLLAKAGPVLTEAAAKPVLAAYGLGLGGGSQERLVTTRDAALDAARAIAGPVALKVQSPDILHKTEAAAVALGLATPDTVAAAYDRILAAARAYAPDAHVEGVLVQPMAARGREVILGINRDPHFGPMLMLGLGGIHVEVLKDVVFSPVPISPPDAEAMIARLKGAALLGPVRGQPAADRAALVDMIVKLSQLAADHADTIAEIDLNPVIVHAEGQGATIADALIVKVTT